MPPRHPLLWLNITGFGLGVSMAIMAEQVPIYNLFNTGDLVAAIGNIAAIVLLVAGPVADAIWLVRYVLSPKSLRRKFWAGAGLLVAVLMLGYLSFAAVMTIHLALATPSCDGACVYSN